MSPPSSSLCHSPRAPLALAALLILLTSSCKLLSSAVNAPGQVASGILGGDSKKSSERVPPHVLQAGVMRFADTFAARITQATQDFALKAGTPEARIQAMNWSIGQNTSAFTIASGPNANIALLDMVVLVTLGRMVHEEYWTPKVWGEADAPMVEAFTTLEQDVWVVASQMLTKVQQDELRAAITSWRELNPDMGITAFVRMPAFRDIAKARASTGTDTGNALGDLLSMDPLSGLEPAVREIEQTRLFGERTVFYLQRAPILLSNQVELLGLKLMLMPEIHSGLEDSRRISLAAESFAETAARLPELVRLERERILADLEKSQEPAGKILSDARATLEAGTQMSTALQGAIAALDGFIAGLRKKEPAPGGSPPPAKVPGKPFDVTDYGGAATEVAEAARELNGLVATVDQSLPQVQRALDEAVLKSDRVVDHAFARGLQLGAILIGIAALAALAVRWISIRFLAPQAPKAR